MGSGPTSPSATSTTGSWTKYMICRPEVACNFKIITMLHVAILEIAINWFTFSSMQSLFVFNAGVRRTKNLVSMIKYANGVSIIVLASCLGVHSGNLM